MGLGQVGDRGTVVALLPEYVERLVQRLVHMEGTGLRPIATA